MKQQQEMVAAFRARFGALCRLPEHRHMEPYTRPRRLAFADPEAATERHIPGHLILALTSAYSLLADWYESQDPEQATLGSWQRYLALPKRTGSEKLMAEVFRTLRIVRLAAIQRNGRIEVREDGLIRAFCEYNRCALSLLTTETGLELLVSCVVYYLESLSQPFSEAYVELVLGQYFSDIVGEIRSFGDDDRVLFQFRQKCWFNRQQRLDVDNPRVQIEADYYRIDMGKYGTNPARYPLDFYITLDDCLYIVPIEVLKEDGSISAKDFAKWQARTQHGATLPDAFRLRFAHEKNIVGLPMT